MRINGSSKNYGWCFDCVPEENSLILGFGAARLEIPAIDLVSTNLAHCLVRQFGRGSATNSPSVSICWIRWVVEIFRSRSIL